LWGLPPVSEQSGKRRCGCPGLAWEQLSAKDICRELTDPARNGGRSLAQLAANGAVQRDGADAWPAGGAPSD